MLFFLFLAPSARGEQGKAGELFTLQVASYPDALLAEDFAAWLTQSGEKPVWGTIEIKDRGNWTRVFVGSFKSIEAARRHGERLVRKSLIKEFLVRPARDIALLSRPRRVSDNRSDKDHYAASIIDATSSTASRRYSNLSIEGYAVTGYETPRQGAKKGRMLVPATALTSAIRVLPDAKQVKFENVLPIDASLIPRPCPIEPAFRLISGEPRMGKSRRSGGLWVGGDTEEAIHRLRWIIGDEDANLISIDDNGRIVIDRARLAKRAGVVADSPDAPFQVARYIYSNEGLLLLVQMSEGQYRYLLHIGRQAPTRGGMVDVTGSINLDSNYDSRINPYRKNGRKLDIETPPAGFDSLIAMNTVARWFNLRVNRMVPVAHILFHEMAEAYAKLHAGLDYLVQGPHPGAHNIALERERRLYEQRPYSDMVLTIGSNRVLRSQEEIRQFYAETGSSIGSQR
jgi:hypothetical protein